MAHQFKPLVANQMLDVATGSGEEIVDTDDFGTTL
jgi:hypothetical protein